VHRAKELLDENGHRYGMVIDLDRCTGCGACMVACAVENNVPPGDPAANDRTGISWLRVYRMNDGQPLPETRTAFVPVPCQQCGAKTPCVSVCPQNAVQVDSSSGIVGQIPVRCLGCRYCMAACPYHARSFNWWDPVWPAGMKESLNPDVSTRTRGVVEKCNFCFHRLQAARAKAAAAGSKEEARGDYLPACVEACPTSAFLFGDLDDPTTDVAKAAKGAGTFRLLEKLGTDPKVIYRSSKPWIRQMAEGALPRNGNEERRG
jgi:menaquinone reductase, iron-sulfur cluster-binding subunit